MRKRPLTAMLTVLAAFVASVSIAACGKEESSSSKETSKTTSGSTLSKKPKEKGSSY